MARKPSAKTKAKSDKDILLEQIEALKDKVDTIDGDNEQYIPYIKGIGHTVETASLFADLLSSNEEEEGESTDEDDEVAEEDGEEADEDDGEVVDEDDDGEVAEDSEEDEDDGTEEDSDEPEAIDFSKYKKPQITEYLENMGIPLPASKAIDDWRNYATNVQTKVEEFEGKSLAALLKIAAKQKVLIKDKVKEKDDAKKVRVIAALLPKQDFE